VDPFGNGSPLWLEPTDPMTVHLPPPRQ